MLSGSLFGCDVVAGVWAASLTAVQKIAYIQQNQFVVVYLIWFAAGGKRQVVVVAHHKMIAVDNIYIFNGEKRKHEFVVYQRLSERLMRDYDVLINS